MTALIITSAIAIVYALIRAKHDSYVLTGRWKLWAFIEAVFIDLVVASLTVYALRLSWFQIPGLALSYAFIFWIVFDCACGWHRARNILYIGTTGWDATARRTFHYNKTFFWIQLPKARKYLLWKLFVGFIVIAGTLSIIEYYG